jgi:hypothetical protein
MPWRGPNYPGELPTLGWYVLDWAAENLIVPDGITAGEPLTFTDEQAQFILQHYAIDPDFDGMNRRGRAIETGRIVRRSVLSRPKGWGKSPLVAALCLVEALADVVCCGWDANGEPVGCAWRDLGIKPKVQVVAMSEDQTINTWEPIREMAFGPVSDNYPIEVLETFINVPRGRIDYATSSGRSREGFRPVFTAMDQTESWTPSNGGKRLAATIRRNVAKVNGSTVETPNAFVPGEQSVAEESFKAYQAQIERRTRNREGLYYDHREAPPETDVTDRESMLAGLAYAYGDSADVNGGWVYLPRILADFWDPDITMREARGYYLNQLTHADNAWVTGPEWRARYADNGNRDTIDPRHAIVLGFDGSRSRQKGTTDATALIGCRVTDGHLFELGVWEQPADWDTKAKGAWRVDTAAVDLAVRAAFSRYYVVGFYADPAKWETFVAGWERDFGKRLKVKASRDHPIEWWMTGGRTSAAIKSTLELHNAIVGDGPDDDGTPAETGDMTHDGSPALTRHVLNARTQSSPQGVQIRKETPDSANKIDAAVAAILAWQARLDALAAGVTDRLSRAPQRIR